MTQVKLSNSINFVQLTITPCPQGLNYSYHSSSRHSPGGCRMFMCMHSWKFVLTVLILCFVLQFGQIVHYHYYDCIHHQLLSLVIYPWKPATQSLWTHFVISFSPIGEQVVPWCSWTAKQSNTASQPSDRSSLPSGMPCPGASGRQTIHFFPVYSQVYFHCSS